MNTTTTPERDEILRGFEIVNGLGVSVIKYRPTVLAAKECATSLKWLQERHPHMGYQMRAIVSVPQEQPKEEPLVLEADEPTTEEVLAEARVANGEYDVVEGQ